ncbi:MAG: hypothetical protein QGI74_08820 [Phycisphaerales bacterium]|jgi:hypothetical protein|nr:hypothetical protein [Phycisphaerales bacterium]MDP7189947.1 hypothetical protein [Phycisphaerales bacterium]
MRKTGALGITIVLCAGCAVHHDTQIERLSQFAPSAQDHVALAADGEDRVLVTWDSRRQQGGFYGIQGRFLHADGTFASEEFTINTNVQGHQMHPAVCMNADGEAWAAWTSWGQDGQEGGIVARWFDGFSWHDEVAVNVQRHGHQNEVVLSAGAGDTAMAVWTSPTEEGRRVHARLLHPDGASGSEFDVSTGSGHHASPSIASIPGGWVIVWASRDDERFTVHAVEMTADGTVGEPRILAADAIEPAIASNGQTVLATWLARDPHGWQVQAQRLGIDDAPQTIAVPTPGRWISGAAAAVDPEGRCGVAWNIDKPVHEVHARIAEPGGWFGESILLGEGAHLERARGTARLHMSGNGTLLAAGGGSAGDDRKAATLLATGRAGTARWTSLDLPEPDLTYAMVQANAPIPPIWDPEFRPVPPPVNARPQRGDIGFAGMGPTGWTPPDPDLAAGPNHVVEVVNGGIAGYTHSGQLVFQDEIEDSYGFWGEVGATSFVFDPEVVYDQRSNRFFAMANERSGGGGSYFLLAVSENSSPAGAWHKYRLSMSHIDDDIDSPNLAVGDDAVYLSCDMFGPDKYPILMVPKEQVLVGDPVSGTRELMLSGSGNQSLGLARSTDDEPGVPQFMLQSSEGSGNGVNFNEVRIHAILDPLGTPSTQSFDLQVPTYSYPSQVPQQGTSTQHYLFEPRFWSCMYRNGSIWAVHHVGSSRARVRWYEIDLRGWPDSGQVPTLAQSGEIDEGTGIYTFFPSIAVDGNNNVCIVFARSASNEYTSMWRALRNPSDPSGTLQPASLVKSSSAPETSGRWGDYSGASPDPDNTAIWLAHEWRDSGGWRTWIDKAGVEPPVTVQVPGDYATIQAAIDDVPTGSIIQVGPGVYSEQIDFGGRSLSLYGSGAEETIIDAQQQGTVVTLMDGETSIIEGFTITGGYMTTGSAFRINGDPAISDCIIRDNIATSNYCILSTGNPVISGTLLCHNDPNVIGITWVDGGGNSFEDTCPGGCSADVDGDGTVGVNDVLLVIANFGGSGSGDVNGDGVVDVSDILFVISWWGDC